METIALRYDGGRSSGQTALSARQHGMGLRGTDYWHEMHGAVPPSPGNAIDVVAPSGRSYHFYVGRATPVDAADAPFFLEHETLAFTKG